MDPDAGQGPLGAIEEEMCKVKVTFGLRKPDDAEVTMQITMPLKDWKELRSQLGGQHPSWILGAHINNAVCWAEERYRPELETEE